MVGDWSEDAVQDGYTSAIQYWNTYDAAMPFENWIGRIIHNATKKMSGWIKGGGTEDTSTKQEPLAAEVISHFFSAGLDIKRAQAREAYLRIQRVDNELQRHCLQFALIDECDYDEVALLTGVKVGTVRQVVKRWRDQNKDVVV